MKARTYGLGASWSAFAGALIGLSASCSSSSGAGDGGNPNTVNQTWELTLENADGSQTTDGNGNPILEVVRVSLPAATRTTVFDPLTPTSAAPGRFALDSNSTKVFLAVGGTVSGSLWLFQGVTGMDSQVQLIGAGSGVSDQPYPDATTAAGSFQISFQWNAAAIASGFTNSTSTLKWTGSRIGGSSGSSSGAGSGSSSGADGGGCTTGAQRCSGNGVDTCGSNGQWGSPAPCSPQAPLCLDGACLAPSQDGGAVTPPSCLAGGAGVSNCGASTESCCTSLAVPAGTYYRSYDGFTNTDSSHPATVSGLRLDRYEATVGRFRQFVSAVVSGWLPAAGSGKHTHLNGGRGLSATAGGYETGWDASWASNLATTASDWNSRLGGGTWTPTAGSHDSLPITEVGWYEAYAFCIWDGGFLPSEAEWNYAATGGSEQRAYPWSPAYPPGSTSIGCADANYAGCPAGAAVNAVGSESPAGDGKWGQADLAGNVWEWTLDSYSAYVTPCVDCANLTMDSLSSPVMRGGGFGGGPAGLLASYRDYSGPTGGVVNLGARCARTP